MGTSKESKYYHKGVSDLIDLSENKNQRGVVN